MPQTKLLLELGRAMRNMTEWLDHDPKLDMVDQLFIENHLQVLQLAYGSWKKRQAKETDRPPRDRSAIV